MNFLLTISFLSAVSLTNGKPVYLSDNLIPFSNSELAAIAESLKVKNLSSEETYIRISHIPILCKARYQTDDSVVAETFNTFQKCIVAFFKNPDVAFLKKAFEEMVVFNRIRDSTDLYHNLLMCIMHINYTNAYHMLLCENRGDAKGAVSPSDCSGGCGKLKEIGMHLIPKGKKSAALARESRGEFLKLWNIMKLLILIDSAVSKGDSALLGVELWEDFGGIKSSLDISLQFFFMGFFIHQYGIASYYNTNALRKSSGIRARELAEMISRKLSSYLDDSTLINLAKISMTYVDSMIDTSKNSSKSHEKDNLICVPPRRMSSTYSPSAVEAPSMSSFIPFPEWKKDTSDQKDTLDVKGLQHDGGKQ